MDLDYYFPTIVATGKIPDFTTILDEFKDNTEALTSYLETDVFNDNISATNKSIQCLVKKFNLYNTKKVMDELFKEYKQHIPTYENTPMWLSQSWLNITGPGGFQDMHTHAFDELVGIFYLNVPENSGNIEFAPLVEHASRHPREVITPFTGMYAFFPGCILHRVTYNKSSFQRISFAFNYKIKSDEV